MYERKTIVKKRIGNQLVVAGVWKWGPLFEAKQSTQTQKTKSA